MAHSPRRKAQALAMLLCGESSSATAAALGIPRSTIIRWRKNDLPLYVKEIVDASPALRELARSLRWLHRSVKVDTKKKAATADIP